MGHDGGPMSPQWASGKKGWSPLKNRKKPGKIGGGGEHGRGGDAKMAPIRHKTPPRRLHEGPKMPAKSLIALRFFPQHLVEGLLNFRQRVCRSFWLDLAFHLTGPLARKIAFHLTGPLAKTSAPGRWVCPCERPHLPNALADTGFGKWDFRQRRFKNNEASI